MKKLSSALLIGISAVLSLCVSLPAMATAKIDPALSPLMRGSVQSARVIVVMDSRVPGIQMPRKYDRRNVINYLRHVSTQNYKQIEQYLRSKQQLGRTVHPVNFLWVNASFSADVTGAGLRELANAPAVVKIYANSKVLQDPIKRGRYMPPRLVDDVSTYQIADIGLDRIRSELPDLNGRGVVLGHVDTGVDGAHPALSGKIISFYDPVSHKKTTPKDSSDHGTHTAGTMVGGDGKTNSFGVAPGAKIVASAMSGGYDSMLESMQHMLDPDGDPNTQDMPRAVNNSWNSRGAPDMELFYRAIGAWEAAGILPVFSAGNSGPRDETITPPHEHPLAFAVAATGADGKVTDFSSRGPARFQNQITQKPDVSAPGDNIHSALPGGKYGTMSGTSMAAPHVTGSTALLFQLDPALKPDQIRKILMQTARPMDEAGNPGKAGVWNKVYGVGKLDLYAAVQLVLSVKRSRYAVAPSFPGWNGLGFQGPEELTVEGILSEEDRDSDWLAYPAALESPDWL